MRTCIALVVLAGFAMAAKTPTKSPAKTDIKDLQGTWAAVKTSGFGEKEVEEHISKLKLAVLGNKISARYGDHAVKGTFTLDATQVPQWIDVTVTKGPKDAQGETFPGIYLLEGDNLLIAFRAPGQKRPENFLKVDSKGVFKVQFKRETVNRKE